MQVMLAYSIFFGWLFPLLLLVMSIWLLTTRPGSRKQAISGPPVAPEPDLQLHPPRHQPGVQPPFVFSEDRPWGWLEYRTGSFHGQRLALTRTIITIGRDEQCDIWLDDDIASRFHAELAWEQDNVYLTDCGSLNGLSLNGHPMRGSVLLQSEDQIAIGRHQFAFILAVSPSDTEVDDDPLARHTWRSSLDLQTDSQKVSGVSPRISLPLRSVQPFTSFRNETRRLSPQDSSITPNPHNETRRLSPDEPFTPAPLPTDAVLYIRNGVLAGKQINLERSIVTVGSSSDCTVALTDPSLERQHVQFVRQPDGDFIYDISAFHTIKVNDQPLNGSQRLLTGDKILLGNLYLEYVLQPLARRVAHTTQPRLMGPGPLRLPSRSKQ